MVKFEIELMDSIIKFLEEKMKTARPERIDTINGYINKITNEIKELGKNAKNRQIMMWTLASQL